MNGQYVLWIGGSYGISRYFPGTDSFKRYYPEENKDGFKTNVNVVYSFAQDSSGQLWVGMVNEGLFYYDENKDRFIRFKAKEEYAKLFRNKYIYRLLATRENNIDILWVGVIDYFIYKIDLSSGEVSHYLPTMDHQSYSYGSAYTIHPEVGSDGKVLWIGTNWMGLFRFDSKTQQFTHYTHEPEDPASFCSNGVLEIIQDKSGILWIANWGGGICKVNQLQPNFSAIKIGRGILNDTKIGEITSFCESYSEGKIYLWIGTDKGLYKIDPIMGTRIHFKKDEEHKNSLSSNHINTLLTSKHFSPK